MNMNEHNYLYGFISTGEKTKMYTLRVVYQVKTPLGFHIEDSFVTNLSNDKDKANRRALEILGDFGIPLESDASFDLNEIRHRQASEIELEKENNERIKAEAKALLIEQFNINVDNGVFLFGKYRGLTVEEVINKDIEYVWWIHDLGISDNEPYSIFSANVQIVKNYIEKHNIERPIQSNHIGEIGDDIEVDVKLKKHTVFEGMYGWTDIWVFIDSDNNEYIAYSKAKWLFDLEENDELRIKAKIKDHSIYRKVKQTVLVRPKRG